MAVRARVYGLNDGLGIWSVVGFDGGGFRGCGRAEDGGGRCESL